MPRSRWLAALLTLAAAPSALAGPWIAAHDIEASLAPAASRIEARDTLTVVRDGGGRLEFRLNAGLEVREALLDDRAATGLERVADDGWIATWRVDVTPGPGPRGRLVVRYDGVIADPVEKSDDPSFVVGDATRGVIGPHGAYLPADAGWYPADGGLADYSVRARIPAPYTVVTQGTLIERRATAGSDSSTWRGKLPADGLALVAGRWRRFERRSGSVTVGAYLSEQNAAGAPTLLAAAADYLALYGSLLGPYPYDRFDIVENWFTTGYGMPGFTLLGRSLIARMVEEAARGGGLPPGYLDHEIVHCWWGNSVFPDYATGNWSEGLTSYCAQERESEEAARAHRERTNVRFTIRVRPERDYPVREFRSKTENFDDDIGYGKSQMLFHMLRREIGDRAFWDTLKRVARERAGKRTAWADWQREFEETSQRNLSAFFQQWLDRPGAPLLGLANVKLETQGGRLRVTGELTQTLAAGEEPWRLSVPLVVELLDGREEVLVDLSAASAPFSLLVPSLPLRVKADPDHHVFRRLAPEEVPPCLAATLEQERPLVVYPDGDTVLRTAAEMAARKGAVVVPASEAPGAPPPGRSLLVFGDAERVPLLASLRRDLPDHFPAARDGASVTVLASGRNPADDAHFVTTFVGPADALASRARAAYNFQFDGRIVFDGRVPRERATVAARMRTVRYVLPDLRSSEDGKRVERTLSALVAPDMDGRLAGGAGEAAARRFVTSALRIAGLDVREQPFAFEVRRSVKLEVLRRGSEAVTGCRPLVASPLTPAGGLTLAGLVENDAAHVEGRGVLLDVPAGSEDPMQFVRGAADLARARGAAALLLRVPADPPVRIAELWETPENLHLDVARRLATRALRGGDGDRLMHAARTAARIGADRRLSLPVVAVPHDLVPSEDEHVVQVAFEIQRVESANVIARLRPERSRRPASPGAIVLGAHLDHLGPGFPGADDDASGVAAVLEAAHVLSVHQDLLGREVLFLFFGAEEWGLRGSRAYVANLRPETVPAACLNVDTVGSRGVPAVNVVGTSHHPRLGRLVAAALGRASLPVGKDIGRLSFADGGDHWPFHELGVPAVALWSGDHRILHTSDDTLDQISPSKVRRVARALALAALAASIGF